jgi:hypothetical protein
LILFIYKIHTIEGDNEGLILSILLPDGAEGCREKRTIVN